MFHLLKRKSFGALTASQFLGAFNDNAFKQLVLLLVTLSATSEAMAALVPWVAQHPWAHSAGQSLPAALFAVPFVLFGALTGSLADRVSKTRVIRFANAMEIGVMALTFLAFGLGSYPFLLVVVFLMGTQSAIFGPSKYGSIPELLSTEELSRGNAIIQMTTMLAILLGTMLGGFLLNEFTGRLWIPSIIYVALATLGFVACLPIRRLDAADPGRRLDWNVAAELARHWRATEGNRALILSIVASAFFYMIAATLILVVNVYGAWLGLEAKEIPLLNALTVIGIAAGSVAAGKISGSRIESGLVPVGLLGMAGCMLLVLLSPRSAGLLGGALLGLGISAGLFTVPIRALIQHLPRPGRKGAILGLSEVLDFTGILLASGVFFLMERPLALTPPQMFLVLAVVVVLFFAGSLLYTAEFALRLVLLVLVHSTYRLRVRGKDLVPREGGALLVANHVSFIDALLIGAACPRPVRFLMYRPFFDVPLVGWFARRMGAIPVDSADTRSAQAQAIESAARAAAQGELVCIFAEGAITRTGALLPFARGMERIARAAGVPIQPVALDRLWGSVFSYSSGRFFWKSPRRIPYPVDVLFGEPVAAHTPAWRVRAAIQEMLADERSRRTGRRGSLAWRFVRAARLHGRQPAVADSGGVLMSYRDLLRAALALRRVLGRTLGAAPNVGVMLPPGAAGVLAAVSLPMLGKAAVQLNYTLEGDALRRQLELARADRVLTSRRFLEKLERESPLPAERTLFFEDLREGIGAADKALAFLASLLPSALLGRLVSPQRSASEVVTILFSSGSTGEPKGVQLTHANILSNVQSVLEAIAVRPGDAVLGVLPFFHSFGYTVTLWMTLLSGAKGVYHARPTDAKIVGKLCAEQRVTIMVATPTFYQGYLRRIPSEALRHLRVAWSGAERLRPALAQAWLERFGTPLMEGYGCTELSPVVSFNVPGREGAGPKQIGNKPGTIGRPLPGVAVRIVDPETGELRPPGEEGLLEVKGPNVMLGYLDRPEATAQVLRDGWYTTGDIALMDRDGFLVITDRLSRFSKIGGEMVPHGKVEELLLDVLGRLGLGDESELAVTAVEDERKGEQLVVLHTKLRVSADEIVAELRKANLPALFVPRSSSFVEVEELPKLGSGKLDLGGLKQAARSAFGS